MHTVITVMGQDRVGILARIAGVCAGHSVNVLEVTQSVRQDTFAMMMMVDLTGASVPFDEFAHSLKTAGVEIGQTIHVMRREVFDAMHTV